MSFFPNIKGEYKRNFQISKLTWFHSGGKAKIFCIPKDIDDLVNLIKETKRISINIIGGGSNMLVRDGGIPGVAIKLGKGFDYIKIKKDHILCGASIKNINLSKKLAKENIREPRFILIADRETDIFQGKRVGVNEVIIKPLTKSKIKKILTK